MEPSEPLLWESSTTSATALRRGLKLLLKSPADLCRGLSCSKIWLSYMSNLVASWLHLANCTCFPEHLRMLLQSLRALCLAPGGPGRIWNYLGAPVRSTGVSGMLACGFRTDLHFADGLALLSKLSILCPVLFKYTLNSFLNMFSHILLAILCRTHLIAHDGTLPACLTICSPVNSQEDPRYSLSMLQEFPWSIFSCTLLSILLRILLVALDGTLPACRTGYSHVSSQDDFEMLLSILLGMLSSTLPIALDDTLPVCLTIQFQVDSQYAPKLTPSTHPSTPGSIFSSTLQSMLWWMLPILLDGTLPASLNVCVQISFQDTLKHIPKHALKYTFKSLSCTLSTILSHILPSTQSSTFSIELNGTLPAYLPLRSQVHSQEAVYFQSY